MSSKKTFNKLFEPGHIGKLQTKNRILKTAADMGTIYQDGFVNQHRKVFYEALAKGGAGIIFVETCIVDYPLGLMHPSMLRLDDDKFIPGLTELTSVIHKYNCPVILQFAHAGPWHPQEAFGLQPISSSPIIEKNDSRFPRGWVPESDESASPQVASSNVVSIREVSVAEIKEIVEKFAIAAERAQKAGFDGVELNAASGHLLNSFLSRVWNKRQDEYGCQNLENRARFIVEIEQAIKKRLGKDFPVTVLISGAEYGMEKGTTIEEAQEFAKIFQAAGFDAIQVRAYAYGDFPDVQNPEQLFNPEPPKPFPKTLDGSHSGAGAMVPLAAAIKKVVSIPVITVGRLDHNLGEKILEEGKADFIGLTRRLIADPELPNKVASGRLEDIRPCTGCRTCFGSPGEIKPVACRVNAALSSDKGYELNPVQKKKKVLIVGGGPAGMEAARVAATRGHQVTLYEKEPKLGGALLLASIVKGTEIEDLPALVDYLETQITKLGVDIKRWTEFKPSLIKEINPDAVILASGGKATVPEIPGIDKKIVVKGASLHQKLRTLLKHSNPDSLRSLTKLWMPVGKRVVIIGGGLQGCELAEFLVKRGRKVTMVDTSPNLGEGLVDMDKGHFFVWLAGKGVTTLAGVKYEEVTDEGLVVTTKKGERQLLEADSILTALPLSPNTGLFDSLKGKVPEVYSIGDSREPRLIIDAIAEGYQIGNTV